MSESTPREVMAQADQHHQLARSADAAMVKIRLGERPVTSGRRTWFRPSREGGLVTTEFDAAETRALYEALADVRNRHQREAKRLDELLTVRAEPQEAPDDRR